MKIRQLIKALICSASLAAAIPTFAGGVIAPPSSQCHIYVSGFVGGFFPKIKDFTNTSGTFSDDIIPINPENHTVITGRNVVSGGGALGTMYDLSQDTQVGLELSYTAITQKPSRVATTSDVVGITPDLETETAHVITSQLDIAAKIAVKLSQTVSLYAKLGTSKAHLKTTTFLDLNSFPVSPPSFQTKDIWGVLAGIGIQKAFSSVWSIFTEYDYYNYGSTNLAQINRGALTNQVFQATANHYIHLSAHTIRLGVTASFAV